MVKTYCFWKQYENSIHPALNPVENAMKTLLPLALLALALSGCRETTTLVIPAADTPPRPDSLPEHIDYQGERYTFRQWNGENAEYYRAGEQDYQWQKLVTVMLSDKGGQFDRLASAMQKQLAREHTLHDIALNADALHITALYPPQPGHPHFSGYESNIMRYQPLPCGIVGMQYAEQHPADQNAQALFADAKARQAHFQSEAARILAGIRCPQ